MLTGGGSGRRSLSETLLETASIVQRVRPSTCRCTPRPFQATLLTAAGAKGVERGKRRTTWCDYRRLATCASARCQTCTAFRSTLESRCTTATARGAGERMQTITGPRSTAGRGDVAGAGLKATTRFSICKAARARPARCVLWRDQPDRLQRHPRGRRMRQQ